MITDMIKAEKTCFRLDNKFFNFWTILQITEFDHLWWRRCFECSASVCEAQKRQGQETCLSSESRRVLPHSQPPIECISENEIWNSIIIAIDLFLEHTPEETNDDGGTGTGTTNGCPSVWKNRQNESRNDAVTNRSTDIDPLDRAKANQTYRVKHFSR
jgi:hypothetical protein